MCILQMPQQIFMAGAASEENGMLCGIKLCCLLAGIDRLSMLAGLS